MRTAFIKGEQPISDYYLNKIKEARRLFASDKIKEGILALPVACKIECNRKTFIKDKEEYGFMGTMPILWYYEGGRKKTGYWIDNAVNEKVLSHFADAKSIKITAVESTFRMTPMFT